MWRGRLPTLMAVAFIAAYGTLRVYWAAGGRIAYTACDQTRPAPAAAVATGRGADHVAALPFWEGWAAVLLCVVAVVVAAGTIRASSVTAAGAWAACVGMIALSFPAHLLFEVPTALLGQPTDWRDVANRVALLAGGLLVGWAAAAATPRRGQPAGSGGPWPRPVPSWVRLVTYAACAVPALGFTLPHAAWMLHIQLGISARTIAQIATLPAGVALAITIVPALGGLLTLGLAARWGQVFPRWMPGLGGRHVPPRAALIPAGIVAVAMASYGVIGITLMSEALATGATTLGQLVEAWAVTMTEFVFLIWGLVLGAAGIGYYLVTR